VHVGADAGIEGAEGLVEEQDLRLLDDGLGDGQALLHAAGQGAGEFVARLVQAHGLQHGLGLFHGLGAARAEQAAEQRGAFELQAEQHVLQHGEVGEHRIALEYDAAVRARLVG